MKNNFKIDGDTLIVYSCKHNQEMLFSVEDFDLVTKHTWCIANRYVATTVTVTTGTYAQKTAHRLLMNPPEGMYVDHINGVRHDNRRSNLRIVTPEENTHNNRSVKGYTWDKRERRYRAQIAFNKKQITLGRYHTEAEARAAYLEAKKIYHPSAPID